MLGIIILLLLCIGALYQWRDTDFVRAIIVTLKIAIFTCIGIFALFMSWRY